MCARISCGYFRAACWACVSRRLVTLRYFKDAACTEPLYAEPHDAVFGHVQGQCFDVLLKCGAGSRVPERREVTEGPGIRRDGHGTFRPPREAREVLGPAYVCGGHYVVRKARLLGPDLLQVGLVPTPREVPGECTGDATMHVELVCSADGALEAKHFSSSGCQGSAQYTIPAFGEAVGVQTTDLLDGQCVQLAGGELLAYGRFDAAWTEKQRLALPTCPTEVHV